MTKFQVITILTCHTMDGQTHTIGKAIRPIFADPVTYLACILGLAFNHKGEKHWFRLYQNFS